MKTCRHLSVANAPFLPDTLLAEVAHITVSTLRDPYINHCEHAGFDDTPRDHAMHRGVFVRSIRPTIYDYPVIHNACGRSYVSVTHQCPDHFTTITYRRGAEPDSRRFHKRPDPLTRTTDDARVRRT